MNISEFVKKVLVEISQGVEGVETEKFVVYEDEDLNWIDFSIHITADGTIADEPTANRIHFTIPLSYGRPQP